METPKATTPATASKSSSDATTQTLAANAQATGAATTSSVATTQATDVDWQNVQLTEKLYWTVLYERTLKKSADAFTEAEQHTKMAENALMKGHHEKAQAKQYFGMIQATKGPYPEIRKSVEQDCQVEAQATQTPTNKKRKLDDSCQ